MRDHKGLVFLAAFLPGIAASSPVLLHAQCINISTGFDQDAAVGIDPGLEDDDYTVDLVDGSLGAPPALVVEEDGFPVPPWFANTGTSKWIGFGPPDSNAAPGTYLYEIHFFLEAGTEVEKAVMIGRWGTDDVGQGYEINGTFISEPSDGFGSLKPFPPNTGLGLFIEGENVVRFQVLNGGDLPNPTGLRVDACVGVPAAVDRPFDLSTGFDEANKVIFGDNASDDDYKVTGPAGSGITNVAATCVADDDFPIPPWLGNSVNSRWVGVSGADSSAPPGEYTFRVTLVLSAAAFPEPARGVMRGGVTADDSVTNIFVNGLATGFTASDVSKLTPFAVDAGQGLFKNGVNTIDFVVQNGEAGPVGLRVDAEVILGPEIPSPISQVLSLDTGFDDDGGALIPNAGDDPAYVILGPPGSDVGPRLASVVNDNAFPIPPWIGTTLRSKWISGQPDSNGPAGVFTYKVKVEIPAGFDATQARIVGAWATDDGGADVVVNGIPLGIPNTTGFGGFAAFPSGAGLGAFQDGENEVSFLVNNGGGPTGLRVEAVVGFSDPDPENLSTGFDPRGIGIEPVGATDVRYRVTGPDGSGIVDQQARVLADSTDPGVAWAANDDASRWVGPATDGARGPAGTYNFSLTFNVSNQVNPLRLALSGSWAAADAGTEVLLNGTALGLTAAGPGALTPFPAGAGRGSFVTGDNVLEFRVQSSDAGAVGLRVAARLVTLVEANPYDISTGFDQANGVVLVEGELDPDYSLTDPADLTDLAAVLVGAPIPPWVRNSPTSAWIGSNLAVSIAPGVYSYEISVDLPTDGLAAAAKLQGVWATDDQGTDILVNGVSTGIQNLGGFGGLTVFPADAGLGLFQKGPNTIQFVVTNGGESDNPSGLRVDAVLLPLEAPPVGGRFVRGDGNADSAINLTDAVFILNYLFAGGATPPCFDAADTDDNGQLQLTDAVRLLGWLFLGGPAPSPPTPSDANYDPASCNVDPSEDDLDCAAFGPCA